ncbi:ShlB/FhaC/HecB family hemolysin secretion/activation protein [Rhodopseudomonas palustris]|uniref:ShlB/FhaC/HecB family hemolysin secretion/activation protein n=1 Tax=Rhodopseudomonas palustris TaxID=1076 RepID=UPI002ACDC5C7|nr:ShlB/FhaC/HecB family hemolysin secretion/activation protein [Rhodopseudomonas palustris]WQH00488.1 ShlB/FhaC/HecB family hemolysin secretion/activation protein [Rhodopseudomonas palustris]
MQFESSYQRRGLASARATAFCLKSAAVALTAIGVVVPAAARSETAQAAATQPGPAAQAQPAQRFDIHDFAVQGADKLPQIEIEEAVYPFLGPNKTAEDVEKARAALEKAYHDKGLQTVSVAVPPQNVGRKVVVLKVTELKVGRLRVKNSRYFDVGKIKRTAPSLKEGTVPNFKDVTKDIVALNQWPDRRVTPALRAGVAPGTVDVDLNVEDKAPIHASVEHNNRQSPSTTATRVNATVHYDNLWQLGHSASFTYQVAPERRQDAEVFSGSYLARLPNLDWINLLLYGVSSNSSVASVGGTNIVGPGQIIGTRAVMTLPGRDGFFHTLSAGLDYKHFEQTVALGADAFSSPVTYYPAVASYGATFQGENFTTQFNAAVTYNLRTLSSSAAEFDAKRYFASPSFTHFNVDVSHTQELPEGFQLWGKVQSQVADGPLVSSEQMSVGGLDSVRGYLESETLGDDGVVGNFEIRSLDVGSWLQSQMKDETGLGTPRFTTFNEWRVFGFADAGHASIQRPLPGQISSFDLWSYGIGSRFKVFSLINGVVVLSVPMKDQAYTRAGDPRFNFRVWGEF